ncbi:hypothetical protein CH379_009415 [Leptospira ellisii]|nr:hypothetical protein [Leptospira ellisii]MDV6235843.1 hypothetical protein [Leptospira ellisii]
MMDRAFRIFLYAMIAAALSRCYSSPRYLLREPVDGIPKGLVVYGIFLYEEKEIPIVGKRYEYLIPFPVYTTLKRICKKDSGTTEPCGVNLVRDDEGPEFALDSENVFRLANRTGLSSDGRYFPYHVLGDMDGSFHYEIINIGSYSTSSRVGTDGIRRSESSYTDYTISNPESYPIVPPERKIDFRGIYAYRATHIDEAPYWIGNLEDGIPILKKLNIPKLNRHFFNEKEPSLENAREYALELLRKDQSKGYWGKQ